MAGVSPELQKKVPGFNEWTNDVENDDVNLMDESEASIASCTGDKSSSESSKPRGEHPVAHVVLRLQFRPNRKVKRFVR